MNTSTASTAPLAEAEDFDNLSLMDTGNGSSKSGSTISLPVSIPESNPRYPDVNPKNAAPPRRAAPSRSPLLPRNNNNDDYPTKFPFPPLGETFPAKKPFPPEHNDFPAKKPFPPNHNDSKPFPTKHDGAFNSDHADHNDAGCCNPSFLIALAYFLCAMLFLVGMNVKGLTLLSFPLVGNLLQYDHQEARFHNGVILLQVMWCAHFIRRCAQTLFLNRYHGDINCVIAMLMILYHVILGMWVGWSLNYYLDYVVPKAYFLAPGVAVYLVGEAGNLYCHWLLRNTRMKPSGLLAPNFTGFRPALPDSVFFALDSHPQFVFEVLTFIGFYLSSHTIAAGAYLVATIVYLVGLTVYSHCQAKKNYSLINDKQQMWKN